VHSLMMGQWGLKHVGVDVLRHCNSNKICALLGLHGKNWIIMHRMENIFTKKGTLVPACSAYTVPKRVTLLRPFWGGNPMKSCGEFRSQTVHQWNSTWNMIGPVTSSRHNNLYCLSKWPT
jgi:hypothetical protein